MKRCLACDTRFDSHDWCCPVCAWAPPGNGLPRFAGADEASFPEEAFESLPELEQRSFWFRARNDVVAWALRACFPRATSLLEVGCGTGYVLWSLDRRFPKLRLAGGELWRAGVEVARTRVPHVPVYELDARRLPFADEFDVVAAFDVLEHVEDDVGVLDEMARAARPGGGILVSVPQHPWLWSPVDEYSGHVRRYTRHELVAKVARVGLRPLHVTSFVSLLLPLVAVSRVRARRARKPFDPGGEYAMPKAVDRLLERVMQAERRLLLERGVPLPLGSSLLVAARRD